MRKLYQFGIEVHGLIQSLQLEATSDEEAAERAYKLAKNMEGTALTSAMRVEANGAYVGVMAIAEARWKRGDAPRPWFAAHWRDLGQGVWELEAGYITFRYEAKIDKFSIRGDYILTTSASKMNGEEVLSRTLEWLLSTIPKEHWPKRLGLVEAELERAQRRIADLMQPLPEQSAEEGVWKLMQHWAEERRNEKEELRRTRAELEALRAKHPPAKEELDAETLAEMDSLEIALNPNLIVYRYKGLRLPGLMLWVNGEPMLRIGDAVFGKDLPLRFADPGVLEWLVEGSWLRVDNDYVARVRGFLKAKQPKGAEGENISGDRERADRAGVEVHPTTSRGPGEAGSGEGSPGLQGKATGAVEGLLKVLPAVGPHMTAKEVNILADSLQQIAEGKVAAWGEELAAIASTLRASAEASRGQERSG